MLNRREKIMFFVRGTENSQNPGTYKSSSIVIASACVLPVLMGYFLAQGQLLDPHLFFTPWHHDDFSALSSAGLLSFWTPRPVSSNFIEYFGQFGDGVYYSVFVLVWSLALVATSMFTIRTFDLRATPKIFLLFAFIGSAIWHCQSSSVQSFQYLGLITNSLSYALGLSAATVFMKMRGLRFGSPAYLALSMAFLGLVFLSSFAKEDMAVFLGFIVIWYGIFGVETEVGDARIKHALTGLAIVVICYVASISHSLLSHSPFTASTGSYDISNFAGNIIRNSAFYLFSTPASRSLYLFFAFAIAVSGILAIWLAAAREILRPAAFALLSSMALMAPYLILPRQFDYYAMNFMPILAFSVSPLIAKTATLITTRRRFLVVPMEFGVAALLSAAVIASYRLDAPSRNNALLWMRSARNPSYIEIAEINRAMDNGLSNCKNVVVTGMDNSFGPFLMTNSRYLDQMLGQRINWTIETTPESLLAQWKKSREFRMPSWVYADAGTSDASSACRLDFDPKTFRASFRSAPALN